MQCTSTIILLLTTPLQDYRFLDLLKVLCVCQELAIPDNQTHITINWLQRDRVSHAQSFE